MKRFLFVLSVFIISLLSGCRTLPRQTETISVFGMVYDSDNRPVGNYEIYENEKLLAISDIGGRFQIKSVKRGNYVINGKGNGYEPIEENIFITDETQVLYFHVNTLSAVLADIYSYFEKEWYEQALLEAERLYIGNEQNSEISYVLALCLYKTGRTDKALEMVEKLKRMKIDNQYLLELEEIIKTMEVKE